VCLDPYSTFLLPLVWQTGKVGPFPFPSVLVQPGPVSVSGWISFDDLPPQAFSPPHPPPFFDAPDWSSSWTTSEASTSAASYFPVDAHALPQLVSQPMSRSTHSDSAYSACTQSSYGSSSSSSSSSTSYSSQFVPTYDDSMPLTPTETIHSYHQASIYSDPNPSYFPPSSFSSSTTFDATSPSFLTVSTPAKPQLPLQVYQQVWGETPEPSHPSHPSHLYTPSSFVYATPQQPTSTESFSRSAPYPFRQPMPQPTPQLVPRSEPRSHDSFVRPRKPSILGLGFSFDDGTKFFRSSFPSNAPVYVEGDEQSRVMEAQAGW
jgi:hypothetical protein